MMGSLYLPVTGHHYLKVFATIHILHGSALCNFKSTNIPCSMSNNNNLF